MASRPNQTLRDRLTLLEGTLASQQEQIDTQQAEIIRLRAEVATHAWEKAQSTTEATSSRQEHMPHQTSRRALLKLGGAAAVGGAVTAAVGGTQVAHAADGNAILIGAANNTNNQASTATTLSVVSLATPGNLLIVDDSGESNGYGSVSIASGANSIGVVGQSLGGYGVVADAGGGVDVWVGGFGGNGRILSNLQQSVGAPSYAANAGEQIRDANGELWLCTVSGTPGTWVKAAHAKPGFTGGALDFLSVPIRVIDTRTGQNPAAPLPTTKAPLVSGQTYTFQITGTAVGGLSVPAGAVGIFANITAIFPTNGGNLIFYPADQSQPQSSTINYNQGAVVGNYSFLGLSVTGAVKVYVNGPANTDVVVDIAGFVL